MVMAGHAPMLSRDSGTAGIDAPVTGQSRDLGQILAGGMKIGW